MVVINIIFGASLLVAIVAALLALACAVLFRVFDGLCPYYSMDELERFEWSWWDKVTLIAFKSFEFAAEWLWRVACLAFASGLISGAVKLVVFVAEV